MGDSDRPGVRGARRAKCSTCRSIPDVRASPGGPLDQPYDAAGWTLPLQMGVTVTPCATPLADDVRREDEAARCAARSEGRSPTPYNLRRERPTPAPFDSVPGIGLRRESRGRGHRAAGRTITRHAARRSPSNPAENNAFRAINRAWQGRRATCSTCRPPAAGALRDQRPARDRRRTRWSTSLALNAERVPRGAGPAKRPRIGAVQRADQHGRRLDALGARAVRLRVHARDRRRCPGRRSPRQVRRAARVDRRRALVGRRRTRRPRRRSSGRRCGRRGRRRAGAAARRRGARSAGGAQATRRDDRAKALDEFVQAAARSSASIAAARSRSIS